MLDSERGNLFTLPRADLTAAECTLAGIMEFSDVTYRSVNAAGEFFALAVEKDLNYIFGYAWSALNTMVAQSVGYSEIVEKYRSQFASWLKFSKRATTQIPEFFVSISFANYLRVCPESL